MTLFIVLVKKDLWAITNNIVFNFNSTNYSLWAGNILSSTIEGQFWIKVPTYAKIFQVQFYLTFMNILTDLNQNLYRVL